MTVDEKREWYVCLSCKLVFYDDHDNYVPVCPGCYSEQLYGTNTIVEREYEVKEASQKWPVTDLCPHCMEHQKPPDWPACLACLEILGFIDGEDGGVDGYTAAEIDSMRKFVKAFDWKDNLFWQGETWNE